MTILKISIGIYGVDSRKAKTQGRGNDTGNASWVSFNLASIIYLFCAERQSIFRSTIFVSNLPYTATSVDLQTLFSDIAPVRTAFVVTEHGTGVSKGVGYVSFAIKEDAQSAFDKITKEGINLVGRNLRVQWAENKV